MSFDLGWVTEPDDVKAQRDTARARVDRAWKDRGVTAEDDLASISHAQSRADEEAGSRFHERDIPLGLFLAEMRRQGMLELPSC
jgi:hypothetical protein